MLGGRIAAIRLAAFLGELIIIDDDRPEGIWYFPDLPEGLTATADAAFAVLASLYVAIGDEGEDGLRYKTGSDLRSAAASVICAVELYLADDASPR